jgi:hypothetical protein
MDMARSPGQAGAVMPDGVLQARRPAGTPCQAPLGNIFPLANDNTGMRSPGRNAPCPCGSGEKYKNCCLPGQELARIKQEVAELPHVKRFMGMVEEGYKLAEKGRDAEAGDLWLEAWEFLKTWLHEDTKDADSLNIMTRDPIVISDWLHTVRMTLGDAAAKDPVFREKKKAFCADVRARLPETEPIELDEFNNV